MKVAKPEKTGMKTASQWLKEGRVPKDGSKGEVMWTNQFCQHMATYFAKADTTADKRKVETWKRKRRDKRKAEAAAEIEKQIESRIGMAAHHAAVRAKAEAQSDEGIARSLEAARAEGYLRGKISAEAENKQERVGAYCAGLGMGHLQLIWVPLCVWGGTEEYLFVADADLAETDRVDVEYGFDELVRDTDRPWRPFDLRTETELVYDRFPTGIRMAYRTESEGDD